MIKPQRLKKGDKVAVVSLSKGMLGESFAIHKVEIAKARLKEIFGLEMVVMPNALKGMQYLYEHPEARAKDLMDAFKDKEIKAIICAVGGEDTIRLLPYIDFDIIKNNPKIFSGFSDTTVNHFMMRKAGLVSFYGPAIMTDFSQYVKMSDITVDAVKKLWLEGDESFKYVPSKVYSLEEDKVWWSEENINKDRLWRKEEVGFEILQGKGKVQGELIGGCADTFTYLMGTPIWPKPEEFEGKILALEICETAEKSRLMYVLRNLQAQGIFDKIKGIIFGKPAHEGDYENAKNVLLEVVKGEAKKEELPILFNFNIGHSAPITVLPLGVMAEIDCEKKSVKLLESPVV